MIILYLLSDKKSFSTTNNEKFTDKKKVKEVATELEENDTVNTCDMNVI